MSVFVVTLHCGQQIMSNQPHRRFCNRKCAGFFSRNLSHPRWRPKHIRKEGPYLPSSSLWWDGAQKRETRDGYVQLYYRDHVKKISYLRMQHIVVWERAYGNRVPRGYHIHHANGDKKDNRVANLLCLPISAHIELHAALDRVNKELDAKEYEAARAAVLAAYINESYEFTAGLTRGC